MPNGLGGPSTRHIRHRTIQMEVPITTTKTSVTAAEKTEGAAPNTTKASVAATAKT